MALLSSALGAANAMAARGFMQINDDFVDDGADSLERMFAGMPDWLGTTLTILIILAIGFVVAFVLRALLARIINATPFGRRAQTTGGNVGQAVGKAAFWLVVLYTLVIALTRLSFADSALAPVANLLDDVIGFIPRLIAAGFILFIGYIVARVAKTATTASLDAVGVDNFMNRTGVATATGSTGSLSNALGTIVFVLVIVPVIIAALGTLDIEAISGPLTNLLEEFLVFIPRIVGAAIVLGLAVVIGRFVKNFLEGVLPTFGFDRSINEVMALDDGQGLNASPSSIVGTIAYIVVIVLGLAAAISILGIAALDNAFGAILELGGRVLTAAVTIIAGVFLANFVARIIGGATGSGMGRFLRYAIIGLVSFMALSQLGIGENIVEILFASLAIGAAVAGSIAFGFGGRDWAGQMLSNLAPPAEAAQKLQNSTSRVGTAAADMAVKAKTVGKTAANRATTPRATSAKATTRKAAPRTTPPKTPKV